MDNKSGSKSNLNESVLPLLEDEINKEKIELKDHSSKDSSETDDADEKNVDKTKAEQEAAKKKKEQEKELKRQKKLEEEEQKKQLKLEKQKKKEEEKELKKQKKAEKQAALEAAKGSNGGLTGNELGSNKNWNRLNQFTVGINLLDRDEKSINNHVNVSFEDVIGEPDATQGFEAAYQLSFGLFQFVRFWIYRILMAIFALPLALIWAVIFSVLSLLSVWIITPGFRVMDILFYFVHRVWNCMVRTFLDPIFSSIALLKQNYQQPFHQTPAATTSGRSAVYKDGIKYNKVNSNETYKNTQFSSIDDQQDSEEQVTVMIDRQV